MEDLMYVSGNALLNSIALCTYGHIHRIYIGMTKLKQYHVCYCVIASIERLRKYLLFFTDMFLLVVVESGFLFECSPTFVTFETSFT